MKTGVLIVGVGGQGTLLASKILGEVAVRAGYDVKVSEVHGMAQRGGSVETHVKFGEKIDAPLVGPGQADYILAFEQLEALRWRGHLKKGGTMIINHHKILPLAVAQGQLEYPKNIEAELAGTRSHFIEATKIAQNLGNSKASNMVLLGVLAAKLGMEKESWEEVIRGLVPKRTIDINLMAFDRGYNS